jgi:hypothetical protein
LGVITPFTTVLPKERREKLPQERPDRKLPENKNKFINFLKDSLSFRIGYTRCLEKKEAAKETNFGTVGKDYLFLNVHLNPVSYWFFSLTFYRYLTRSKLNPWEPEFSYAFGYDDWHPNTFNLMYSNYSGNRICRGKFTNFSEGVISGGYKFNSLSELAHAINLNYKPSEDKTFLTFNTRWSIYKFLYAQITAYIYLQPEKQKMWDPDFTYSFGWFDWRPFHISVEYSNYGGNRFPWHKKAGNTSFKNGCISIHFGIAF